jgi:hypothetical protein
MKYKYPIGTKIRYKGYISEDVGKIGKIVGYKCESVVWVIIPNSHVALAAYQDSEHQWSTHITNLEITAVPNQQLVFDFMYEK